MSKIETLLAQLSPAGVEFRPLGEVAVYSDTRIDAGQLDPSSFVGVDNLLPKMAGRVDANYSPNTSRLAAYALGDVLLGNIRPYLQKIWLADRAGGCSGDVLAIRIRKSASDLLLPEFLFRVLASKAFFTFNMQHAKGAKMPRGDKAAILRYQIPLPPIEIQQYIVDTLRIFTKLEAELEAELEARRQQYSHYRDALLSFGGQDDGQSDVQWMRLNEIGQFIRGRRFTKADYVADDGINVIHYGEIYTQFGVWTAHTTSQVRPDMARTLRYAKPGDVVITDVGETVEDVGKAVAWIGEGDVAIHDHCYAFRHAMNPKFISYCMQTSSFVAEKAKYVARTKVNTLLVKSFSNIRIPTPSLEEQERIVGILDKFYNLINDLSNGLPAEVKARRKQYEHYRDQLLAFKQAA